MNTRYSADLVYKMQDSGDDDVYGWCVDFCYFLPVETRNDIRR
jgi:hypothetical protein